MAQRSPYRKPGQRRQIGTVSVTNLPSEEELASQMQVDDPAAGGRPMNIALRIALWGASIGLSGLSGIATTRWDNPAPACYLFGLLAGVCLCLACTDELSRKVWPTHETGKGWRHVE